MQADAQLLRSQHWPLSLGGGREDERALAAQPGDLGSGLSLSLPSCATLDKSLNFLEPQGGHGSNETKTNSSSTDLRRN